MPKRDVLTQKVFTQRKPNYTKVRSPIITEAEKEINDLLKRNDIESTADPHNKGDILVVFIHGFAASKYCWLDPDVGNMGWVKDYANDPPARDFGWHTIPPPPYIPVDWTLSNQVIIHGASTVLDKAGVEWLTYSQGSAFGDIELSVDELKNIMKTIRIVYGERRIIIIAHSRGGLISKRYLDTVQNTDVEKLITFGTPFGGTFMSSMETLRSPSKLFLNRFKTARKLWDVSQERRVES
ncbi:MAG: esterase/lipase family protein, partial [Candidatus Heimdallarchaeota archaeon]